MLLSVVGKQRRIGIVLQQSIQASIGSEKPTEHCRKALISSPNVPIVPPHTHVCLTAILPGEPGLVSFPLHSSPNLHLASSEQRCWSGGRGILTELSLCYSIV